MSLESPPESSPDSPSPGGRANVLSRVSRRGERRAGELSVKSRSGERFCSPESSPLRSGERRVRSTISSNDQFLMNSTAVELVVVVVLWWILSCKFWHSPNGTTIRWFDEPPVSIDVVGSQSNENQNSKLQHGKQLCWNT